MKSFFGHLLGLAVTIVLSLLVMLFGSYVSVDVAHTFQIPILRDFTMLNFFGLYYVIGLFKIGSAINKNQKDFEFEDMDATEILKRSISKQIAYAFILLISWGMAHLGHWIMF